MRNCDSAIQPYALGIATLELELLRQRQKAKELWATYCTEISEMNINLLPKTCNFHPKFRFIFSLHLSENAQNVHFREAKFQNLPGSMPPDPPSGLAPSALDTIFAGLTLNFFRRACYFQSVNTQYNITYLTYTKRRFFPQ